MAMSLDTAQKPRKNGATPPSPAMTTDPDVEGLQELLHALTAATEGDFSIRLPARRRGLMGQIAARYNELVELNANRAKELARVGRVIGREGRMTERMAVGTARGSWATSVDSINSLIDDLVRPTTEVARVLVAVAEDQVVGGVVYFVFGFRLKIGA